MSTSIFVTGAEGFIGSHLVTNLLEKGYKVNALVMYNSFNQIGWLREMASHKNLSLISGDIRDPFLIQRAIEGSDAIIHLAALISIPHSYEAPSSYVHTNVEGTLNVLEAARKWGNRKVLTISSSEVYGSAQYTPIDEAHPLVAQSPYSATKIAAEKLTESYHLSYQLPTSIIRPFNTYGPRQSVRAIIPAVITQLLGSEGKLKVGNLFPTRDFVFVKDTVRAIETILTHDSCIGKTLNISSEREVPIRELIKLIAGLLKKEDVLPEQQVSRMRKKESELDRLLGSSERLFELTGWKPSYNLEQGIMETIDWFVKNKDTVSNQYHL
ncbi:MAG: GDP-mannose 4,6-dehydratase [Bacteroidota bacterium]